MDFRAIFQPRAFVFAGILVSQAASARTDAPAMGETPSRPSVAQKVPGYGRALIFEQLLQKCLNEQGDTCALHDLESTLHKVQSMAISLKEINFPGTGKTMAAELDRGYWHPYSDSHYAGCTGPGKPAVCATKDRGIAAGLEVPIKSLEPDSTLGWDLSRSRRLVPVLGALERNRNALTKIFELNNKDLSDPNLAQFFSAQFVAHVWNGDAKRPCFSNYWDGSNGRYRVAYSNGMDRCLEGYQPVGLSSAFPTEGYASWERHYPNPRNIGLSLLDTTADCSPKPQATSDSAERYGFLMPQTSPNVRLASTLVFWPSLVGVQ